METGATYIPTDDGVSLRTWTSGQHSKGVPVLLLHGGPGLWDYLKPVADMLDPFTTVHRFDQRGCGGSGASKVHTVERYLADIETLRMAWGHDRWIVAGHSFGASLAFAYAAAFPDRTAGMIYLCGTGLSEWHDIYRRQRRARMTGAQQDRLEELKTSTGRTPGEEAEFRTLSWFTDYADPVAGWRWAAQDAQHPAAINSDANQRLSAQARSWDDAFLIGQAQSLAMPCLFVHGDRDCRPHTAVQKLASAAPHAAMAIIGGAGHFPWREQPQQTGEVLRTFIAQTGARPR